MKKILSLILVFALVFTLALTGCSKPAEEPEQPNDDTSQPTEEPAEPAKEELVVMSGQITQSFDQFGMVPPDVTTMNTVCSTLLKVKDGKELSPCLAESWIESEDGMSITYKIREDVYFHNGELLTGEDVLYTFETLFAAPFGAYLQRSIASFELVSPYEFKITKTLPYVKLNNILTSFGHIVNKKAHMENPEAYNANPIGTGPYKFSKILEDQSVEFVVNENYFEGTPAFKKVTVRPPLAPETAVISLENKEIDFLTALVPSQLEIVQANDDLVVAESEGWSMTHILLQGEKFKSNLELRKAAYYAVNRENAMQIGSNGLGEVNGELCTDIFLGKFKGYFQTPPAADIEKAKEALANSGYDVSQPITLTIYAGFEDLAASIQADFAEIGLTLEIESLQINDYYSKFLGGQLEMTFWPMGAEAQSMEEFLGGYTSIGDPNGRNGYKSEELDAIFAQIQTIGSDEERKPLMKDLYNLIIENFISIPLYSQNAYFAYNKELTYDVPISGSTGKF